MMWWVVISLSVFFIICIALLMAPLTIAIRLVYLQTEKKLELKVGIFGIKKKFEIDFSEETINELYKLIKESQKQKAEKDENEKPSKKISFSLVKQMLAPIRLDHFSWHTEIGLKHANQTAISYGILYGLKHMVYRLLDVFLRNQADPIISVQPNYQSPSFQCRFNCILKTSIGHIISSLISFKKYQSKARGGDKA